MMELQEIINKQVDTKVAELSQWKNVRWEGGRLYYESQKILSEIHDYSDDTQLLYLETLLNRKFTIQDNLPSEAPEITGDLKNWISTQISKLRIKLIEGTKNRTTNKQTVNLNDIFIVHGHNNVIKTEVAFTLSKLGLNPIILHEQPNAGKTIIEKIEDHSKVGFAIVLITDDDIGKSKTDIDYSPRPRQNVVLELGYFIAKLGRDKVCPLYLKGVELPSDIQGLLYVEIDRAETWKIKLVKELKSAGYNVDANKII